MAQETHGLHHFHKRFRTTAPHPFRDWLDHIIYFVGVVGPIMTLPQLYTIWATKNATGVSLISWSAYLITSIIWLIYACAHREKPLIFMYVLWTILELLIVVGVVLYG